MNDDHYADEVQYLEDTVEFIDREVARLRNGSGVNAAHRQTQRALREMDAAQRASLEAARPQPYFGRGDFSTANGRLIEAYIGARGVGEVDHRFVHDWRAPFPGAVFYADPSMAVTYTAPGGEVTGRITLKRQYAIEDAQLLEVAETYRSARTADSEHEVDSTDRFMSDQLAESRTGELRQAVATLQPQQYQQVAAAPAQVMLVEGVAGSGKSVVGLHRVAYLLSPLNAQTTRIDESRVVIFGPSRSFLRYVANLLPSLDVRNVRQTTISDWLMSTLTRRVFLDRREPLLEKLLRDRGESWGAAERAVNIKGSLRMARAQERHVERLRTEFIRASTEIVVLLDADTRFTVDAARVRRIARALSSAPLNTHREQTIDRLAGALGDLYGRTPRESVQRGGTTREFIEAIRPYVEEQVSAFWPRVDPLQEYRGLLTDPTALTTAAGGAISAEDVASLSASLPKRPTVFTPEDLGALCHLDHLLNDRAEPRFDHVVIDEAQEVSVIELLVIRMHSRNNGFTILGDLAQRLSPQGIDSWRDILQVFRGEASSRYRVRTSYRSTYEITRFANRLLKKADHRAVTAVPFHRPGPRPDLRPARDYAEMVTMIEADIEDLGQHGATTIGILCKSTTHTRALHLALRKRGLEVGLLTRDETPTQPVVVAPIHVTRGLEYDAVILAGTSRDNYPSSPLHSRLLYVGASRAAHHLRIRWFGPPAAQLGVRPTQTPERRQRR